MAVPKRKVSSARQNKRRSNVWKLSAPALMKCPQCGILVSIPLVSDSVLYKPPHASDGGKPLRLAPARSEPRRSREMAVRRGTPPSSGEQLQSQCAHLDGHYHGKRSGKSLKPRDLDTSGGIPSEVNKQEALATWACQR